jgi:hypothetical protein
MNIQNRTAIQRPTYVQVPESPPATDYVLVPRTVMAQILLHVSAEQSRFPSRRLRQTIRIIQHVLGYQTPDSA